MLTNMAAAEPGANRSSLRIRTPQPAAATVPAAGPHVVQLAPGETASAARRLTANGAQVLAYLPDNALLVAGPVEVPSAVSLRPWTAEQAVSPELAGLTAAEAADMPDGVPVIVGLVPGTDVGPLVDLANLVGAEVVWVDQGTRLGEIGLLVPARHLVAMRSALAGTPGLVWADIQPPVRLRNSESVWRCQSGVARSTPIFEQGIHGEGQIVGIMDTGLDIDHCFFRDDDRGFPPINDHLGTIVDLEQRKVIAVDFWWDHDYPDPTPWDWDDHGHGTHVAGSVAGDEGGDGEHQLDDGMAPGAWLVIQDGGFTIDHCADLPGLGCPVRNLGPVMQQAYDQCARLHSNSWGDEEDFWPHNRYTERTADVDRFSWEHKDFLVFFAAGNSGDAHGTVGSPATGKNVVGVGATVHGDSEPVCPAPFSSRGWTHDGRIKPDVMAPGISVRSSWTDGLTYTNQCIVFSASGTSMACPTVAGLAALVRQYYADGFYPNGAADPERGFSPSAALVKATLIAAAVDLRELGCDSVAPVPSRDQGWGLVELDRALAFAGDAERLLVSDRRQGFTDGSEPAVRSTVLVPSGGPMKVVLVWTDPPSSSAAEVNLVNDLDLVVSGPGGTFRGNAFEAGRSSAGGEPDRLNNVEVVWLPEAAAGRWTVSVAPHAVNLGEQDYALVMVGAIEPDGPRNPDGLIGP